MLLFLSLPTLSVLSSPSMTWIAPPRMVFSFTTIPGGITKIQPTLEALLHQNDRAFDAIYVIVPRVYRNESVEIPSWLLNDTAALDQRQMLDVTFATGPSVYHDKVHVVLLDTDYGPASKLLGALLVENDPETIIVYGDDDRMHRPELTERVLYYSSRFPDDAIAVLGGWIAAEDSLYCGRSLEVGVNRVSFVGGAGGVVVKRKFYGTSDEAIRPAFDIVNRSKGCFLGDDYYLSLLLSRNRVPRRLVYDTCWNIPLMKDSYRHGGLSYAESSHPGGANVEHYQQCIRELGKDHDLSGDGEFNAWSMYVFSHVWGLARGTMRWSQGESFVPC
ncbi:hypothetical protein Poli38472_010954 [Pythium oligandrum]|uniref:Uncharacterized protein n=1 Tax=Pythium oligandrum TaxID=41045 RepID=A0A8K1FGP8_PYTOL|nr:hypothetical protein Poli38472_010954 [Pythium oligandrum]|eukprot:TMW61891.1 hypothetical protein Poli38472_010954 [Pythium oligandrum]